MYSVRIHKSLEESRVIKMVETKKDRMITKEEVLSLRKKTGMKQTEFAKYFGIPYRTYQDWELGKRKMAAYMFDLMKYKLHKEGLV